MLKVLVIDQSVERFRIVKQTLLTVDPETNVNHANTIEEALFLVIEQMPHLIILTFDFPSNKIVRLANIRNNLAGAPYIFAIVRNDADVIFSIKAKIESVIKEPINNEEFATKIIGFKNKIQAEIDKRQTISEPTRIKIITNKGYHLIHLNNIVYCKADGSYTTIFLANGESIFASYNLGRIEEILIQQNYFRINRSIIVNLNKISYVDKVNKVCGINYQFEQLNLKISNAQMKKMIELDIIK